MNEATAKSQTRRAVEVVADNLMHRIRSGDLPQGRPLPTERELCTTYNTSRPTIREAISRLQYMGYLKSESGHRPLISRPSLESVLANTGEHVRGLFSEAEAAAHIEQLRQFIEVGAVRIAVREASPLQLANIKQRLDDNFAAIGTLDFPETDIEFHGAIVSTVGNPVLMTTHELFRGQMVKRIKRIELSRERDTLVFEEHRAIFDAVVQGNEVVATDAMDRHLFRSYRDRLAETLND